MASLSRGLHCAFLVLITLSATVAFADNARFDLTGPKVEVRVTRGGKTLPIAAVPNLQVGDKLFDASVKTQLENLRRRLVEQKVRGLTDRGTSLVQDDLPSGGGRVS